jgi:hypothetical protein
MDKGMPRACRYYILGCYGISSIGVIKGNWKLCPEGPCGRILLKRPFNGEAYGKYYFKN